MDRTAARSFGENATGGPLSLTAAASSGIAIRINVIGDERARRRFIDAAINAVEQCAPLEFAPALAAGIGGQVFTMQFASKDEPVVAPAN